MRAVILKSYGDEVPDFVSDWPEPSDPVEGDVQIRVKAASINPIDWKIMAGKMKPLLPLKPPFVLGSDGSGIIEKVGSGVSDFAPGDEVYFRTGKDRMGTFAEKMNIRADEVAKKPASLKFEEAASIPLVALTSYQAFFEKADLQPGQKVLIHAGSGGVGTAAIQIAKEKGAEVTTTAGPSGIDLVKRMGADHIINYRETDFSATTDRFDLVFDTMGGDTLRKSFLVTKPGGYVVSIASLPTPDIAKQYGKGPLLQFMLYMANGSIRKWARKSGANYRYLLMHASGEQLQTIGKLIENGNLKPVLDSVYPIEQAAEAFKKQKAGHAKGKIVLTL